MSTTAESARIVLPVRSVVAALALAVLLLVAASLAGQIYLHTGGHARYLVAAFDLDGENNVPTWFSAFLLVVSAQLAAWIALLCRSAGDSQRAWVGMVAILFYLAVDEVLQLHEQINGALTGVIDPAYFPWLWAYASAIALLGVVYGPFLWRLPRRTGILLLVAGAVYIGGGAGMELADVPYHAIHGKDMVYALLETLEETLEMAGVVLLIYALLDYVRAQQPARVDLV